ncbi:HDOD domain-containing protein [Ferrimonas balearica]|uniref:HDOD domain-containing protein n=1 Tax=Ferrimonas balearica TaxID=44012 RepID=UPI001C991B74|nr:HDOD domain-containing protein [Ferrimonas balearica]MBY5922323.1 HDOD domain-containing protein [Ferrimonas balearica]MBY5994337.1 HDOD domain-containing protein [Ferrimonas balearica]
MDIERLFEGDTPLPSLNRLVQQLLSEFSSHDPDLLRIARILSQDQALSAKVLRLANSAHFAGARQVDSIRDAAIMLGLNNLRMLVICSAVQQRFVTIPHLDLGRFWRQNLACSQLAGRLAKRCRLDQEQARLGGLLHSIGQLYIHQKEPRLAQQVVAKVAQGCPRAEVEKQLLEFDYGEVGAELARRWQFPASLALICRHHIRPDSAPEASRPLVTVVALARWRVEQDMDAPQLSWPDEALNSLGLTREQLYALGEAPTPA